MVVRECAWSMLVVWFGVSLHGIDFSVAKSGKNGS
jgi:hypothetical protein